MNALINKRLGKFDNLGWQHLIQEGVPQCAQPGYRLGFRVGVVNHHHHVNIGSWPWQGGRGCWELLGAAGLEQGHATAAAGAPVEVRGA